MRPESFVCQDRFPFVRIHIRQGGICGITVFGAHFLFFIAFHIADLQGFCYNIFYSIRLADNVFTALNRLFSENVTKG